MKAARLLMLTTILTGMACAQEPALLTVTIPENAAPVLVLEGVDVAADVGVRITVQALGRRLGSASLVGSSHTQATAASEHLAQLIIPLDADAAQALAHEKTVALTVSARTMPDDKPSAVKVVRAYFRTADK